MAGPRVSPGLLHPETTIMVVEDDPDLRDALEHLLAVCGYPVIAAADGGEALRHLRGGGTLPCLILLDLFMPGKDGFQFRAEQLADVRLAGIPTIAYSGVYTGSSLREKAASLGFVAVFEKPVDYHRLLDLVEQHCASAKPAPAPKTRR